MDVELARHQWEDGTRRLQEARSDRSRFGKLMSEVDLVVADLRQRVGQHFTLAELADAYDGADEWVRELLAQRYPDEPAPHEPGTVTDAAFHVFARGASDYRP